MNLAASMESYDSLTTRESNAGRGAIGTLMWIGETNHAEFQPAYEYCVANAAQIAIRRDLTDALTRPAVDVRRILIARKTRDTIPNRQIAELDELYPHSSTLSLWGSLGEGLRDGTLPAHWRLYWHRWNQMLPEWLGPCGATDESSELQTRTVAVLSSNYTAAEPLLELAESAGATAVWSTRPDTRCIRNVESIWWDDSVAGPVTSDQWRNRIAQIAYSNPRQHAWIVNSPRLDQHQQATQGGINLVVSKPNRIECLLQMLDSGSGGQELRTPELKAA